MDIEECLDELQGALLRDVSSQIAGDPDDFWPKPRLLRYINEAQRRFARRALCIRDDSTPAVAKVALVPDQVLYTLHPSVLRVLSARHQDATQDMVRMTHPNTYARMNVFTDHVASTDVGGINVNTLVNAANAPAEYSTDESVKVDDKYQIQMLVRPTPSANQAGKFIYLRTIRLPLLTLALDDASDESQSPAEVTAGVTQQLEIPDDYALDMLEWAAFRAWRTYDAEDDNGREWATKKANTHSERFEAAVRECRREIEDKLQQPLKWGFGQGAFGAYIKN